MKKLSLALALVAGALLDPACTNAAFIVEAHVSGKANATNFAIVPGAGNATGATASTPSTAAGLSGTNSIFGSNNTIANTLDVYRFSYTPGSAPDADNTVFAPGDPLGNSAAADADGPGAGLPTYTNAPQLATGLVGGGTGYYNVYFTTPTSTNVSTAGSRFDLASDSGIVTLSPVVLNDGSTGPDEVAGAPFTGGANNRWLNLGTVLLTAGTTYTVTQTSNVDAFTSQRAQGVMWEYVGPVPEPASILLSAIGLLGIACFRRRNAA